MKKFTLSCAALFAGLMFSNAALACPGDFDGDGTVGVTDLMYVLAELQNEGVGLAADLNSDGKVDMTDLMDLLALLGTQCED